MIQMFLEGYGKDAVIMPQHFMKMTLAAQFLGLNIFLNFSKAKPINITKVIKVALNFGKISKKVRTLKNQ